MAKKKETKQAAKSPADPAIGRAPDQPAGGIAADDLAVLEGDIDSRMAALLKDHQEMGSRPK
jgi:hypothetical protein